MVKVKIENIKTKVVKEVEKAIASDYLGTGVWKLVEEKKEQNYRNFNSRKEEE
nr:MAG TPA: hypothetical protein [Bacteriophage sp.]